ncbi:SMEK domain-containing protein [Bizionia paragorgiae]|uniref:SMEK domain-containing protein n=1 Tax=Bizionia paragorgiae TaxID=283786 RepID=UPI003A92B738
MNRKDYIDDITKYSSRFVEEVKGYNSINKYDINIHAENALIPILNVVFNLNLKNLNSTRNSNYPAIDLADLENRVAIQVTSTNTNFKINETLRKFKNTKLSEDFDVLYIYLLADPIKNPKVDESNEEISQQISFETHQHILDNKKLLKLIEALPLQKIKQLSKIFMHEFSDVQIDAREVNFKSGYLSPIGENLYLNLLELEIPNKIYQADLNIKEDVISQRIKDWRENKGYKVSARHLTKINLLKNELKERNMYSTDWVLRENKILTFRNLHDSNEFFSTIVDGGTIVEFDIDEYFEDDDSKLSIFKDLLSKTFTQDCSYRGLEWVHERNALRFKIDSKNPGPKQVKWKATNYATKTVISEIRNKTEGHLICFRHLAFEPHFEIFNGKWYLAINSTWSFTNPGGYKASRFEKDYMAGVKRLENNKTIFYFFQFWSYYLKYKDLFSKDYRILKFKTSVNLYGKPSIEDKKWLPEKPSKKLEILDGSIELDNELNKNLFDL